MCPLRFILIFFSAALAAFFALRNLENLFQDSTTCADHHQELLSSLKGQSASPSLSSKVASAAGKGFWTFVDMASGHYLWRTLVSSSSSSSSYTA
ncbi:hypothetical protein ACFX1Z_010137 [Malus domestica]